MSAHPFAERLSAFLDQELPDEVRLSIEEHLRTCDACAAHLAELASVDEAARALPLEAPAGYFDDFAARVRGRLVARPVRRTPPVWTWAAAAAALLAVVTPLAMRERAAESPAPAVMQDEGVRSGGAPEASARAAAPAASAAEPQAPAAAEGTRMAEGERSLLESRRRANQVEPNDRLLRRDQAVGSAPLSELQASRDKREALAPEPAPATLPPARLEEKAVGGVRTFGYASPPAAGSQRPHGPHLQQQVAPPPAAAPAPADTEAVVTADAAMAGGAEGFRDADLAKERDDRSPRQKRASPSDDTGSASRSAAGGAAEAVKRDATGSVLKAAPGPAETGDEARRRRETFRRMALEDPEGPSADEARVGTIVEGVRAYRLDGRAQDRATAERDGRAYLARPDALQAAKVRALLKELEGIR